MILDFELSIEDMKTIDSLDQGHFLTYDAYEALQYLPTRYQNWKGF